MEPCYLVFHWSAWYVWGWCRSREDFRLFKLNRMTDLTTGEEFPPRAAPLPELEPERLFPAKYQVTVLFDPSCRWRLVEEYGADRFTMAAALHRRLSRRGQRPQLGAHLWG